MANINPELAQTLLDQGHISNDLFSQITSPQEMYNAAPEITPEIQDKWARDKALQEAMDATKPTVNPRFEVPPMNDLQAAQFKKDREAKILKYAESKKVTPPIAVDPQISLAQTEISKRDAGLPYDEKIISSVPRETLPEGQGTADVVTNPSVSGPSSSDQLLNDFSKQEKLNLEAAKIGQAQATQESAFQKTLIDEQQRQLEENQAREQERQAKLNQHMEMLNERLNQYDKSPANIAQSFANKTTGGKILAGIALFLGAAPNGTAQNSAVQTMQAAIDSDLAKQKAGFQGEQSIYNQMREAFGDERQADAATRLAYLNNAQLQLNQIASQYKSDLVMKNAQIANQELEKQKHVLKSQFEQATLQTQSFKNADDLTVGISRLPKELQGKALEEKAILDKANADEKTINSTYDELSKIGFVAGNLPKSESKARLQGLNAQIASQIQDAASGKWSDAYIKKIIEPFLVEPSDGKEEVFAKRDKLKQFLRANQKATPLLSGYGLKPKSIDEKYSFKKS